MNLDQLTDAVMEKLGYDRPRALLIGSKPEVDNKYNYVNEEPYDLVVIGKLSAAQLLQMPSDPVCDALMEDMPVYLWQHQPWRGCKTAKLLCKELLAAEQHLYRLGVMPLGNEARLLTAQQVRELLRLGKKPDPNCRMTPLARDVLEGKEP